MDKSLLGHIEAVVESGRAVISADEANIVAIVQEATKSRKTASFYLSRDHADAFKETHWTTERVKAEQLEAVSDEERSRIESELGLNNIGSFRITRLKCDCGATYGPFEFFQQGVREHGLEAVKSIFEMKNASFIRVNPALTPVCPNCNQVLEDTGITYEGDTYGGCSYPDPPVCR
ncbi:hypothetical protein [Streptomyces roseochromogenus]|uniref:hypothetical protein n=1 Tax=Streptomyces roseochromogenus TaxID=285450 RepID=UPI000A771266|nr:hypothetical protein [Streptomyces roseochromogenus]